MSRLIILTMGNCCKKGLLQKLDHNTFIYYLCSESERSKAKEINITLEKDIYTICPNKDRLAETD